MRREIGVSRLTAVVKRNKLAVGLTAAVALAAGLYWVKTRPSTYEARAVVRIDDPRPSRDYVPPTVNEPGIERLKSARRGIISRPVVAAAVEKIGKLPANASEAERERIIASYALRLDARQEGDDTFVLKFEHEDPVIARTFVGAVAESYMSQRALEMGTRARATANYFAGELEALRPRLAAAEQTVEAFRAKHYGSLPDQLEENLRVLDATQMQIAATQQSLDSALNRRRAIMESAVSPIRRQEEDVMKRLSAERTRFQPDAPEVVGLQKELERVRADRLADEEELSKKVSRSAELRGVEAEIDRTRTALDELNGRKGQLEARIAAVSKTGEQYVKLALDRDMLRERLKTMLARHEDAALAAGLESGVGGAQRVTMVEPAWVSGAPVKPSKPLYAMIALALALALGLGVGLLADSMSGRIRSADDLRAATGDVPLLGAVPRLAIVHDDTNKKLTNKGVR